MEWEDGKTLGRWEDLSTDILWKIFESFNDVSDLSSAVEKVHCSAVCSAWRSVLCDPHHWHTLDLSMIKHNFVKTKDKPYVYVCSHSDLTLSRVLKVSLSLSHQNITTLIFNLQLYVPDDLFTYTAERCPKLRRLVMPSWNKIKIDGISKAIGCWKHLESLTIGNIEKYQYLTLLQVIDYNCKNFRELKLMGTCDTYSFASAMVRYLPKLEVLSLRCSMLSKDALMVILEGLPNLEVLNISHCVVLDETHQPHQPFRIVEELDASIVDKASRLKRFITCMRMPTAMHVQEDSCSMCQRARNDEGIIRWHRYEEGMWKADEVASLAL
ncbi:hypothetical protein ACE6H2_008993 [Prunus campanulata]